MKNNSDLKRAIMLMLDARKFALQNKRDVGDPHNPCKSLPGQEHAFERHAADVRALDLTVKALRELHLRDARAQLLAGAKEALAFAWDILFFCMVMVFFQAAVIAVSRVLMVPSWTLLIAITGAATAVVWGQWYRQQK